MTESAPHITEAELHTYVDGQLSPQDQKKIEAWLAENPESAAMVAKWRAQNDELRNMFAPYAKSEPADLGRLRPLAPSPWRRYVTTAAAAVMIFALGATAGIYGTSGFRSNLPPVASLPQQAQDAYLIYASEVRHPVEVFAEDEAHLVRWLGKRLSKDDLKLPDLQSLGFLLIGGRLLPLDGKPGAMFMYESQTGERITILVRRDSDNLTTSFRSASSENLETFYWVDNDFGYAVTGEVSRSTLQSIARTVYRQLEL